MYKGSDNNGECGYRTTRFERVFAHLLVFWDDHEVVRTSVVGLVVLVGLWVIGGIIRGAIMEHIPAVDRDGMTSHGAPCMR